MYCSMNIMLGYGLTRPFDAQVVTGFELKNSRSILRAAAVLMTRRTRPTRYDTTL
jgi:hypothetical protein